jgi:hypothetical protein
MKIINEHKGFKSSPTKSAGAAAPSRTRYSSEELCPVADPLLIKSVYSGSCHKISALSALKLGSIAYETISSIDSVVLSCIFNSSSC